MVDDARQQPQSEDGSGPSGSLHAQIQELDESGGFANMRMQYCPYFIVSNASGSASQLSRCRTHADSIKQNWCEQ